MSNLFGQVQLRLQVIDENGEFIKEAIEVYQKNNGEVFILDKNNDEISLQSFSGQFDLFIISDNFHVLDTLISLNEFAEVQLNLKRLSVNLSSVEIAARKKKTFTLRQLKDVEGTSIFAGKKNEVIQLELVKGNLANNVSRQIYAQIPGLNIYEGSDGGIQLGIGGRGLDPNRTSNFNTRQNGYDISADVLGYPENYYTPPAQAIEEIQILRGASSLQYGSQFGGLLNFKLKKIKPFEELILESAQTYGSFGLFNSFNYLALNKGKFSINTYYNYKRGDGFRANSEFDLHNLFFNIKYQLSPSASISADFSYFNYLAKQAGGLTDQQFELDPLQSTRDRNWFDVDWKLFNVLYEQSLNEKSSFSFNVFALDAERNSVGYRGNPIDLNENPITGIDEQAPDGSYINPRDLIKGDFNNYGAEFRFLHKHRVLNKRSVLLLGAKYYNSDNNSVQGPGSVGVDADFTLMTDLFPDYANQSEFNFPNKNLALFTEQIYYLSDRLSLTPGLRYEYIKTSANGFYNQLVFDNAGNPLANNRFTEARELPRSFFLFGLGLDYRLSKSTKFYANISENYRSVTFSDIRVVNPTFIIDPDIRDESGFTFDFGFRGSKSDKLKYDASIFSLYYSDRIGIIFDDRANRVRKNIGDALIVGVESIVDLKLNQLFSIDNSQHDFSLFVNSSYTYSNYVQSEESNVEGKQVEFVPSLNLKLGLSYSIKDFSVSLQYGRTSEQFTDAQNSPASINEDLRSGVIGTIPAYQILDLSISQRFKSFTLDAGVNNLLNELYFTRRATGYPGPGIIPSESRSFYFTLKYFLVE